MVQTGNVGTSVLNRDDATPDGDYVSVNEELTFQPGDESRKVYIEIINDDRPEIAEVFMLALSSPECNIDGATRKIITIQDDDGENYGGTDCIIICISKINRAS